MTIKMPIWLSVLALCLQAPGARSAPPVEGNQIAPPNDGQPAMRELGGLEAKPTAFQSGRPLQPKVIRSEKEAGEYLTEEATAEVKKRVDFSKESVLLFAWRGSGQDHLKIATVDLRTTFSLEAGRTKDLREHVKVLVLGKNAPWGVGISWEETKTLILKDRVRHAMQLHNRRVTVSTQDGTHYETIEPMLDDIIRFIRDNKKDIPIATE
jgi:hypothetical protein